ncbi:MAG TPA: EamA family transporter [Candidatus Limnocylindrales bacterium]|nr:EamA family transporter [Candidatus Limnocylindrales bacterium]
MERPTTLPEAPELRLTLGYAFALFAAALFGVGGVIAKEAFAAGLAPSELAELRVLFAFLVLLLGVAAFRPQDLRVRRGDLPLLVVFGVVGLGGVQWAYYEAIQRLPLGVALVIQYTAPLLILLYWRLRGRHVGGRLWLAGLLTLGGCSLVVGAYDLALLARSAAGTALAVLSALIFALYFLLAERILSPRGPAGTVPGAGPRAYTIWTLLVYGFGFALLAWMLLRPLWTLPWDVVAVPATAALVAGVVVVASVLPFTLTFAALSLIPAARVGLTATAEPVVGALAAYLLLGERLEPPQLLGGAVVLVGIGIAQSLRPRAGSV